MSKRRSGSYGHRTQILGWDHVRLFWVVDYKCDGSRLRYPRTFSRDTDLSGAQRFIKRWGLDAQKLLGHTSPTQTARYLRELEAVLAMGPSFGKELEQ